jgi:gentisate 1,2-dioxygenase
MSVQLVKPGEVAEAHRHSFAATRFIVQGGGAYTTVDGEALWLSAGDYVTTPGWCWHDHANPSPDPIVWLDIHDNPFVGGKLNVRFGEKYPEPTQPFTVRDGASKDMMGSVRRISKDAHPAHQAAAYPWAEVRPALERAAGDGPADPYDGVMLDYTNPVSGSHLLPTIGVRIQMLQPKERTQPHRHTSYTIYHVVEGEGVSVVGDKRFEWSKGDCFTVPNWEWHTHEQSGSQPAVLFSVHDQPILEAFDLYREEREEA